MDKQTANPESETRELNRGEDSEDADLRSLVRGDLPPEAFRYHPWRVWLVVPRVLVIVGLSVAIATIHPPWYIGTFGGVLLGNLYIGLMLFAHEVSHGGVTPNRWIRHLILYPGFLIYLIPPHLWSPWHNAAHHGHTNVEHKDPDGTIGDVRLSRPLKSLLRIVPASSCVLSILFLFVGLTMQAYWVFWRESHRARSGSPLGTLKRGYIYAELASLCFFWLGVFFITGWFGFIFLFLIPYLTANAIIMSYVVTNHLFWPTTIAATTVLENTTSVRTIRILDWLHLNFSHHVEHHLFPKLAHRYYPLVRRSLLKHRPHQYCAPLHWKALWILYTTPTNSDGVRGFIGHASIDDLKNRLSA